MTLKTMDQQKLLNWLTKEQQKDKSEIEKTKQDFAKSMLKMKKDDLFKQQKPTLWKRIKKMIWGI